MQTFYPDNPNNKLRIRFTDVRARKTSNNHGDVKITVWSNITGNGQLLKEFKNYEKRNYNYNESWTSSHESGAITIKTKRFGDTFDKLTYAETHLGRIRWLVPALHVDMMYF